MALTLPAHQVHFEGITEAGTPVLSEVPTSSPIKAYNAKEVLGDANKGKTTVGMFYPGAVYDDAAGQKQRVANMGHFGRLDSLEGAAKMASMNVFTAADGGK